MRRTGAGIAVIASSLRYERGRPGPDWPERAVATIWPGLTDKAGFEPAWRYKPHTRLLQAAAAGYPFRGAKSLQIGDLSLDLRWRCRRLGPLCRFHASAEVRPPAIVEMRPVDRARDVAGCGAGAGRAPPRRRRSPSRPCGAARGSRAAATFPCAGRRAADNRDRLDDEVPVSRRARTAPGTSAVRPGRVRALCSSTITAARKAAAARSARRAERSRLRAP
jgi:hypothetical protein